MIVVLMGVCGCGKSTIGNTLSEKMNWKFLDADDFHPQCNKDKMQKGISLTDEDRFPWLMSLHSFLRETAGGGDNVILACSALKKAYRGILANGTTDKRETKAETELEVLFVHLHGSAETIGRRLQQRQGHFMSPELLQSQLATLEPPGAGEYFISIDVDRDLNAIATDIIKHLVNITQPQD
ncbi:putative gluconokinase isoform X1 [Petromyzon marinus]|uniref:putative gluconokinase isoform X1 n=1 Tax=Petromyzon marinus TaxID=7757 RepID=UPI003F7194A8